MAVALFIEWSVNPNIPLPISAFTIQWYGLMWTLSILACYFVGRYILQNEKLTDNDLVMLIQYLFLGSVIGARLGQVLFYDFNYFLHNPMMIFAVWNGGLASHGGVIGAMIALYFFHKNYPQYSTSFLLDSIALVMFIPITLIRLGNLFNSELIGKVTELPWGFVFTLYDKIPRHPVVLYEAIAYFIGFLIAIFLYKKYGFSHKYLLSGFFFCYVFTIRFLLEFLKEPEGMVFGLISKTQLLSLPMIAVGIYLIYLSTTSTKKENV